jgi:mevalonate kinase
MMWTHFKTHVPGKWVLTGEHAVLRGATAVALPHPEIGLTLSFDPNEKAGGFAVEPAQAEPVIGDLLTTIADALKSDGKSFSSPQGRLRIDSTIPMGAGLGSSAALCVAMTRWVADPLTIPDTRWMEFSTQLEHRFHGTSSGMDVAVISAGEPISFVLGQGVRSIGVKKLPKFTFHDTGLRSRTSECVIKVEKFHADAPALAVHVDQSMGAASQWALEGLREYDAGKTKEGLELLRKAMNQARECFYSWELVPGAAKRLEEELLDQGALAVKLTGAGGGGMVVALWPDAQ